VECAPALLLRRAARTLLDLRETWESTTKEERRDLVHIMIQEVGVDVTIKRVLWVKARLDYEPLFSILDGLRQDAGRRFWIECLEAQENNCDIEADIDLRIGAARRRKTTPPNRIQPPHNPQLD
jgi:hypothetical protein